MSGVLDGFGTIGAVIALGFVLAHFGVVGEDSQLLLSRLAFFVASPALMVIVLSEADVSAVLSKNLAASAIAISVTGSIYVVLAKLLWNKAGGELLIGTLASVYVNAGNLGLPIAAYVLGDAALVAPILLLQLIILQPASLVVLDSAAAGARFSPRGALVSVVTNPLTLGSLGGLVLSITDRSLPLVIHDPLALLAGMAVPGMLLAYGVSLRLGPRPVSGVSVGEVTTITGLKLLVQPVAAYVVARFAFDIEGTGLYAVTVLAALPTAQNIFVNATRYNQAVVIARDAIFLTTVFCVPALFVISALLA